MKVAWTDTARHSLRTIHDYIAQSSPAYAKRMVDRLTGRSKQIGVFPLSGRVVPEFAVGQIREVFQRPYRIIYHIRPDHIDVIGVLHMSRKIRSSPLVHK